VVERRSSRPSPVWSYAPRLAIPVGECNGTPFAHHATVRSLSLTFHAVCTPHAHLHLSLSAGNDRTLISNLSTTETTAAEHRLTAAMALMLLMLPVATFQDVFASPLRLALSWTTVRTDLQRRVLIETLRKIVSLATQCWPQLGVVSTRSPTIQISELILWCCRYALVHG